MSWAEVERLVREGVSSGVFPGAVAGIQRVDEPMRLINAGRTRSDELGKSIHPGTWFDLASLTKVFATGSIVARLVDRNDADLSERVADRFPELPWHAAWKEVTLEDLLSHQSGYAAHREFQAEPSVLSELARMPSAYPRRRETLYSDLGFILLGSWLERKFGKRLDELFLAEVAEPLNCREMRPWPLREGIPMEEIPAARDVPTRGGVIQGEVDDDNAFLLGGFAGHAGLFATAEASLHVSMEWISALRGSSSWLKEETARRFVTRVGSRKRGLAWDLPTSPSSAGSLVSLNAFGHLGYSGTSVWIDPDREAAVVLLTNRVHPTAENKKIQKFRPIFHDAVWEALDS